MKKITILIIVLLFGFVMQAQVAISMATGMNGKSKFEKERFTVFKNTTTIFVLNNLYEKKQYEDMLKSCWTITPFEVVALDDFKYENYLSDKYSFCMLDGYSNNSQRGTITKFYLHFYILDMEHINKKIKKYKGTNFFDFIIDKRRNLAYIDLIPKAEIYDLTENTSPYSLAPGEAQMFFYSYFNNEKSKDGIKISNKIYNENVFHNYNLGMLKNNIQNINRLLLNQVFCSFDEEVVSPDVKQLKKQILYLPDYLKKEYHTKPIEYKEYSKEKLDKILSPYPYKIEFISEKELETKILNNEEFYYLNFGYHLRYFQIVNSKTGDVIYKVYPNGMMKANLKESDFKDLVKAINKQK